MSRPTSDAEDGLIAGSLAGQEVPMSRYERAQFFETLLELRAKHDAASEFDRRSEISIDDAIAYAEAVMMAISLSDIEDARALEEFAARQQSMTRGDPRD
jgi:hypothetical protein